MSPAQLGILRALGVIVLASVVHYFTNAANLHGVVGDNLGSIIAIVALAIEHSMAAGTDTALFGTVRTR